jgi:membrane protease YdiL (CAAX protease family)/tetratricopeptide (TPR) repeat protein
MLLACLPHVLSAQTSPFITDHAHHLQQLGTAKDSLYKLILAGYDQYILVHPTDHKAHIQRCRFIETAYYDSYEEYNPNYELAEACAGTVLQHFPENPEVLLYPTSFLYGDTLVNYLHQLEDKAKLDSSGWSAYRWDLYHQLAQYYGGEQNHEMAIHYGELALVYNDTLDVSLLLGRSYRNLSKNMDALDALLRHVDSTDAVWSLNEKGKLLMELGANDKAIEAFRLASHKNAAVENSGELADAMINNGLVKEARNFLMKEVEASADWNAAPALRKLLLYDINFGSADSAKHNYRKFAEENFYNDVFGIYRMRMIAKAPLMGWTFADGAHVLFFLLLLALVVVIPYLWILPIHYYGAYRRQQGKIFPEPTFQWGLRHLWIASSLWLASDVLALLIFDYPSVTGMFLENSYQEPQLLISKTVANLDIFFFVGLLTGSIALLKREDFEGFIGKVRSSAGDIGIGIMLAIGLKIALGIYVNTFSRLGVDFSEGAMITASVTDSILSINKFYSPLLGFLFVVVFAPFYEEILYRGVFLSACQKNMALWMANLLQASVFTLVHQSMIYFPFYLGFGLLAGYFTRKTGSLITSTSMHMMNNAMAFFYLLNVR